MTKQEIINRFLEDKSINGWCANPDIFQTSFAELARMYDLVKEVLESKSNWKDFLRLENAINEKGEVVRDRLASYYDKEKKQNISVRIVFKYFVYNWLKKEIEKQGEQLQYAQGMNWVDIMEGNFEKIKDIKHLEALARGLQKVKDRRTKEGLTSPNTDKLLNSARQKYLQVNNN
jgi:hypothetical protein